MSFHEIGDKLYISNDIVTGACEDHPQFILAKVGDEVIVTGIDGDYYRVVKQDGKIISVKNSDLMFTKPTWESTLTFRDYL